jgi:hypothetical protein
MADTQDELEARRWFRQRLAALKAQYPQLQETASQDRLAAALPQLTEEPCPCPENPPATPEADQ